MDVRKLQFFNYNGYNLNFDWNSRQGYWEGMIYLPKVSVGLYANTTIYILEETPNNDDTFSNEFSFPSGPGKITFSWDTQNTFVDEFFMFNFDENYTLKETSALIYTASGRLKFSGEFEEPVSLVLPTSSSVTITRSSRIA